VGAGAEVQESGTKGYLGAFSGARYVCMGQRVWFQL